MLNPSTMVVPTLNPYHSDYQCRREGDVYVTKLTGPPAASLDVRELARGLDAIMIGCPGHLGAISLLCRQRLIFLRVAHFDYRAAPVCRNRSDAELADIHGPLRQPGCAPVGMAALSHIADVLTATAKALAAN